MGDIDRSVAIVTGARRGIGRAIAYAMAEAGFDMTIVDVESDAAARETEGGLRERGARAIFLQADIADLRMHPTIVERSYAAFGRLDCLVNNAGVQVKQRGDLLDVTPESFDRVMGINLRGTFFLTQAAARRMIADPPADPPGHRSIITISSANAFLVAPDRPEYGFSKTSLSMMTKMFAAKLGPHAIAAYEVQPGIIRTDMTAVVREKYDRLIADGLTPIARWGEPADVGRTVATLAAGAMPFSTGATFHVDGGLHIHKL